MAARVRAGWPMGARRARASRRAGPPHGPMTRGAVAIGVSCAAAGSGCAAATGQEAAAAAAAAGAAEDADDGERGRAAGLSPRGVAGPPPSPRDLPLDPPTPVPVPPLALTYDPRPLPRPPAGCPPTPPRRFLRPLTLGRRPGLGNSFVSGSRLCLVSVPPSLAPPRKSLVVGWGPSSPPLRAVPRRGSPGSGRLRGGSGQHGPVSGRALSPREGRHRAGRLPGSPSLPPSPGREQLCLQNQGARPLEQDVGGASTGPPDREGQPPALSPVFPPRDLAGAPRLPLGRGPRGSLGLGRLLSGPG